MLSGDIKKDCTIILTIIRAVGTILLHDHSVGQHVSGPGGKGVKVCTKSIISDFAYYVETTHLTF